MRRVTRRGVGLCLALAALFGCLVSCSVTRTITTTQIHTNNRDTTAVMTTKNVETYTATKTNPLTTNF